MTITEQDLKEYRPLPFYYITTHDPEELTYEKFYADLSDMKEKGYGGIVLFNRPPEGFTRDLYFTEDWFSMVGNCVKACHDLKLRVFINDDYDAPPGDVGGRMEKRAPHLKQKRLRNIDGKITVEEVPWLYPAFEEAESAELFHEMVYEEYKRRFGAFFGNTIVGFFSDSDSRRVNSGVYDKDSPMLDYFPWSSTFAESFQELYGYDILPYLPEIMERKPSRQAHDYWEHCGTQYHSWFASNYAWCQKNGLLYTFHNSDTSPYPITRSAFNSAFAEGKAIDAGQFADYPGTDHECLALNGAALTLRELASMPTVIYGGEGELRRCENFYDVYGDLRAKQKQSCAYLYDKKGVMCEMYAAANWNATYKELRNIAAYQMMHGVIFVVYQAYHYRYHGRTKYFAPPMFGPTTYLDFNIKQFNDEISRNAFLCAQGNLEVDIALLDPTDHIWAGVDDSETYLQLAKKLNRKPQGYILSDIKGIQKKAKQLKAVINPGLQLSEKEREQLRATGLLLLEAEDFDNLDARVPTDVQWTAEKPVMFMRRRLEDGHQMLVLANVENEETVQGTLRFEGKTYEIQLCSGEMAFVGGGVDLYHTPDRTSCRRVELQQEADVTYQRPNIIPLFRWESETGDGFSLVEMDNRESFILTQGWLKPQLEAENVPAQPDAFFRFTAAEKLKNLSLLIPTRYLKEKIKKVSLDGADLKERYRTKVFDDAYTAFSFDAEKGSHTLYLQLEEPIALQDASYLTGDFDVEMTASGGRKYCASAYAVQVCLPENMQFTLSPRRKTLRTDCSWADQGQPFYSGQVTYTFTCRLQEGAENVMLHLDGLYHAAIVYENGREVGRLVLPPYQVALSDGGGSRELTVCVHNTDGNQMEGFRMKSGLTQTPYITYR